MKLHVKETIESSKFQNFIVLLILINAVTLGLETSHTAMAYAGNILMAVDKFILGVFVIEITCKIFIYRLSFFRNGWNVFDFAIVSIALLPATGAFSVLRALRILRVLRLLTVVPSLRAVISALFHALPGMASIITVLMLVFYMASVIATKLFGHSFPEWFGTIGASMYSLFQVMTLESWSMGIVRPVMEIYPLAWLFFVPFIVITSFAVLNLFIGIIVNSLHMMSTGKNVEHIEEMEMSAHDDRALIMREIKRLRKDVKELNQKISSVPPPGTPRKPKRDH